MTAVTRGVGPDSWKVICSNEGTPGMETGIVLMSVLCTAAMPPPRPLGRAFSIYVNPGGVVWFSEK